MSNQSSSSRDVINTVITYIIVKYTLFHEMNWKPGANATTFVWLPKLVHGTNL